MSSKRSAALLFCLLFMPALYLVAAENSSSPSSAEPSDAKNLQPYKDQLERFRQEYRQSVGQYGANSPQALGAREKLRNARHSFHNNRREQMQRFRPEHHR